MTLAFTIAPPHPATSYRRWTDEDRAFLAKHYATRTNDWLALRLDRSPKAIGLYATKRMGLHKGLAAASVSRFKPGHVTWNKGRSYHAGGASKDHLFKPGTRCGAAREKFLPVGSVRFDKANGVWIRKIADAPGPRKLNWRPVHVLIWEQAHGPVPAGRIVVFADRDRTNFAPDNLLCLTRSENLKRNTRRTPEGYVKAWQTRKRRERGRAVRMVQLVAALA